MPAPSPLRLTFTRGERLLMGERYDQLLPLARTLTADAPHNAQAHYLLGKSLERLGRLGEAIAPLRRAAELAAPCDPNRGTVLYELASCLRSVDPADALRTVKRAALLGFDSGEIGRRLRSVAAASLLSMGDFAQGWPLYPKPDIDSKGKPLWEGGPLGGSSVGVITAWGLGDVIISARWLPSLKRDFGAARVTLLTHAPVARLLSSMPDFGDCVDAVDEGGDFDFVTPLHDLPYHIQRFGGCPLCPPYDGPYLRTEGNERGHWARRMDEIEGGERPALRVGCVWAAGSVTNGAQRSFPATALSPLGEIPGVRLYSLQKGKASAEAAGVPGMVDIAAEYSDLAETAGVINSLDLVLTCDTSVVHLSGALGRATFVLLPYLSDWRWGARDAPALLYPRSVRKFQQRIEGDWSAPIAEVMARVAETAGDKAIEECDR